MADDYINPLPTNGSRKQSNQVLLNDELFEFFFDFHWVFFLQDLRNYVAQQYEQTYEQVCTIFPFWSYYIDKTFANIVFSNTKMPNCYLYIKTHIFQ